MFQLCLTLPSWSLQHCDEKIFQVEADASISQSSGIEEACIYLSDLEVYPN